MRGAFVLLTILCLRTSAQVDARSVRSAGMVGCSDTSIWVTQGNPASASLRKNDCASVSYVPGPFGLRELRRFGAGAGFRIGGWGNELHLSGYGSNLFTLYSFLVSLSRSIGEGAALGVQIGGSRWNAMGYPTLWSWNAGGGFLYHEGPVLFGARVRLSDGARLGPQYELAAGVTIEIGPEASLTAELLQQSGADIVSRYCLSIRVVESLGLFIGWQDAPYVVGAGASIYLTEAEVTYGGSWHVVLGWTHGFGLGLRI